ncbi:hypothetical protein CEXT_71811 [Caerostris extrusa]|uniref:Uncharacterized protein n=1 Tax=Caerostris extrusa TaxID=172846 RepID=A0AAV4NH24_CAEEX|nr:hypothetical protein CEXT_71811 [Caerostris extrusa]
MSRRFPVCYPTRERFFCSSGAGISSFRTEQNRMERETSRVFLHEYKKQEARLTGSVSVFPTRKSNGKKKRISLQRKRRCYGHREKPFAAFRRETFEKSAFT